MELSFEVPPDLIGQDLPRCIDEVGGGAVASGVRSHEELERVQGFVELYSGVDEALDSLVEVSGGAGGNGEDFGEALNHAGDGFVPEFYEGREVAEEGRSGHARPFGDAFGGWWLAALENQVDEGVHHELATTSGARRLPGQDLGFVFSRHLRRPR